MAKFNKVKTKKRDKSSQNDPKQQHGPLQADHEMFLQSFEKPTQIYRYLRSRNIISPIFLYRNLSYMRERRSKRKSSRSSCSLDSLLAKVEANHKANDTSHGYRSEYMNLTFSGFYDQENSHISNVQVEVSLMKVCHKKRKDVSSPVMQISVGKVTIPVNKEPLSFAESEMLSVSSSNFNHNNGHSVKSYVLLFKSYFGGTDEKQSNGILNGVISEDEPATKRPKRNAFLQEPSSSTEGEPNQSTENNQKDSLHEAELVVYDKLQRCQLVEGDYGLVLRETNASKARPRKNASWETVLDGKPVGLFEVFDKCPTLKFQLSWSHRPLNAKLEEQEPPLLEDSSPAKRRSTDEFIVPAQYVPCSPREPESRRSGRELLVSPSKRKRIFYQFLYHNNTRQQTEARDDLHCPWCSLNCLKLYPLLKHLRTCHARFNFTYVEHPKGARVDVAINECYDGSYVGNPQDLHSHIGYAFSRSGPVRRTPVTQLLVYRPKKAQFDLGEFLENEGDTIGTRQLVQGHNRLYFHLVTCQPVRPCEMDELYKEDRSDPNWLRQKTVQMIDEFTDVNEGEKEVMKMWNLHIMHHGFIGDCQISKACQTFVEIHGKKLLEKNLLKNFTLHLTNLSDFGLIRPETVYRTCMQLIHLRNHLRSEQNKLDMMETDKVCDSSNVPTVCAIVSS